MTETATLRGGRLAVLRELRISALRDFGIVFAFLILFVVLTLSSDVFLTQRNWMNILDLMVPDRDHGVRLDARPHRRRLRPLRSGRSTPSAR